MPKDNDCLYHGLAHSAGGTADTTRKVICEETLKHPKEYWQNSVDRAVSRPQSCTIWSGNIP